MDFNQKVWNSIKKIPKGKISTYKLVAKKIGKPKAVRAVGNACNKNPFSPLVPCHRVVKSDGSIGGFAFGKKKKIELLKKEGIQVKKGKINGFEEKVYYE
ncbi:MGMT family protein [Candidatus Micrarchaeota archaeon]|nr:MGMT family protein [Candidatus Micrarchaeota archaeon]MBU2476072.1 MGMT family protein [Candidatus Micrarchaeota archaeon]